MNPSPLLLVMRGIHKRFPGVQALKESIWRSARAKARAGGENGAGKSTLMHILAGVYQPDAGVIEFDGQPNVVITDERAAQQLGIAIVFQERSLFGPLSVAENIFAGRQPTNRFGKIDRRILFHDTRELLRRVALPDAPQIPVEQLSPAQQQMVEIAKALSVNARLMIFDEPTASLTDTETRALFAVIAQLKQQDVGIVYISHRLEEIFQIADRVTVLKDGAGQGTMRVSETTPEGLVSKMVGRDLSLHQRQAAAISQSNAIRLEVAGLSDEGQAPGPSCRTSRFRFARAKFWFWQDLRAPDGRSWRCPCLAHGGGLPARFASTGSR